MLKIIYFTLSQLLLTCSFVSSLTKCATQPNEEYSTISTTSVKDDISWIFVALSIILVICWLLVRRSSDMTSEIISVLLLLTLITIRPCQALLTAHTLFVSTAVLVLIWRLAYLRKYIPAIIVVVLFLAFLATNKLKLYVLSLVLEFALLSFSMYSIFYQI